MHVYVASIRQKWDVKGIKKYFVHLSESGRHEAIAGYVGEWAYQAQHPDIVRDHLDRGETSEAILEYFTDAPHSELLDLDDYVEVKA